MGARRPRPLDRRPLRRSLARTASLPCYSERNVDTQRGSKVFERSIEGLKRLNALGYGVAGSGLKLDLVYNPGGAFLPPAQEMLHAKYTEELQAKFGVVFNELFTMTNMPIKRFADLLAKQGKLEEYMKLLVDSFNPVTVNDTMCRTLVSVSHDGSLYDCDFNQALAIPLGLPCHEEPLPAVQPKQWLLVATALPVSSSKFSTS